MDVSASDFDYHLPDDRIAQHPATPRESAKLMILDKKTGAVRHDTVGNFPGLFGSGDVLVINNTKVFHARLHGTLDTGSVVELFLIRPKPGGWLALGKPGKKLKPGMTVTIHRDFTAGVLRKNEDGTLIVDFHEPPELVIQKANIFGKIPVPPYITEIPQERDYQTVYAKHVGSVAAPTAGFHLTDGILAQLKQRGVTVLEITLHVGLGTFMPIKSETLETHTMHSEWAQVTPETARVITDAKRHGRRIIAVGTTTVRTLEGVAALNHGALIPFTGDISLFIRPGFEFRIIDAMLTNFHLPKSTLIVLVSAFAGKDLTLSAYKTAVDNRYRFYSFGDAMFIS